MMTNDMKWGKWVSEWKSVASLMPLFWNYGYEYINRGCQNDSMIFFKIYFFKYSFLCNYLTVGDSFRTKLYDKSEESSCIIDIIYIMIIHNNILSWKSWKRIMVIHYYLYIFVYCGWCDELRKESVTGVSGTVLEVLYYFNHTK